MLDDAALKIGAAFVFVAFCFILCLSFLTLT